MAGARAFLCTRAMPGLIKYAPPQEPLHYGRASKFLSLYLCAVPYVNYSMAGENASLRKKLAEVI